MTTNRVSSPTSNGKVHKQNDRRRSTGMLKNKYKNKETSAAAYKEIQNAMDTEEKEEEGGRDIFQGYSIAPIGNIASLQHTANSISDKSIHTTDEEEKGSLCKKVVRRSYSVDMKDLLPITSINIPIIPQSQQQQPIVARQQTELTSVPMKKKLSNATAAALDIMYDIIPDEEEDEEIKQKEASLVNKITGTQIAAAATAKKNTMDG